MCNKFSELTSFLPQLLPETTLVLFSSIIAVMDSSSLGAEFSGEQGGGWAVMAFTLEFQSHTNVGSSSSHTGKQGSLKSSCVYTAWLHLLHFSTNLPLLSFYPLGQLSFQSSSLGPLSNGGFYIIEHKKIEFCKKEEVVI